MRNVRSISSGVRSRNDLPWTMAALLIRTVGVPSFWRGKKDEVSCCCSKEVGRV